jgi:hypothetical protein
MYARTIYWRVTKLQNGLPVTAGGAFGDLKTLKGATRRLERRFPTWTEIVVQYEPFPIQGAK